MWSRSITLCAALGALGACGPSAPAEPPSSEAVPSARAGMETSELAPPVISAEVAVSQLPGAETPAVARGGDIYLVVWTQQPSPNSNPDIYAVRVRASDGAVLDSTPIVVSTGPSAQYEPTVAFDGTNFLVVWIDVQGYPQIRGARVRASDGAVLDPTSLLISKPPSGPYTGLPQFSPSVAFDGVNYIVVWHGYYYDNGPVITGVLGTRVRPSDLQTLEVNSFSIDPGGRNAKVAAGGGLHMAVWEESGLIIGRLWDMTRGPWYYSTAFLVSSPTEQASTPAVAATGSQFLTVWNEATGRLVGNRINTFGQLLDGWGITLGGASLQPPRWPSMEASTGCPGRARWPAPRSCSPPS